MRSASATPFVGRRSERADLLELVGTARVLTVIGPGGAGKTRLAQWLLEECAPVFGERSWSVGLADCQDPALVPTTVAAAVGMSVRGVDQDASELAGFLDSGPAVLLLDNCEHLLVEVAELAALLVSRCPELVVLATSRAPLAIAAETTYPVGPMQLPFLVQGEDPEPEALGATDAVGLFLVRAAATLPGFALTPQNARTVAEIVTAIGGIPLAIELAAARLRSLDPEVLLARLGAPLDVLGAGPRDATARHRTLEASVDWSYQLCSPRERAVWRRLSVFAGGFDLEAAEAVCAEAVDGPGDVLDLIGSLVDQSVLSRDPERPTRYQMLEVIRHFGVRQLEVAGETVDARRRHLGWCRGLVEEFAGSWYGPDQVRWLDRLRAEHPNIRVALDHATDSDAGSALRIVALLDPYWISAGHFAEGRLWTTRALRLGDGPEHLRARLLALRICGDALRGNLREVEGASAEAARLLAQDPDPGAEGMLGFAAAMVAAAELRPHDAVVHLERAARCFTVAGEGYALARVRYHGALELFLASEPEAARELASQVLADADRVGDLQTGAYALWVLGMQAIGDSGPPRAEELLVRALDRAGKVGDQIATAFFLEILAWVVALRGDAARSAGLVGAADAVWRTMGLAADRVPQIAGMIESGIFRHRVSVPSEHPTEYRRGCALLPAEAVGFALSAGEPEVAAASPADPRSPLTKREAEIAELVTEGLSNRGIADSLHLSERTVQGHVQSILRKLDFRSRVQVAAWVLRARD